MSPVILQDLGLFGNIFPRFSLLVSHYAGIKNNKLWLAYHLCHQNKVREREVIVQ